MSDIQPIAPDRRSAPRQLSHSMTTKPTNTRTPRPVIIHVNSHLPEQSIELKTVTNPHSYTRAINQAVKLWRSRTEDTMPVGATPAQITICNIV